MDHLRSVVERITYQNEENGYSVIKVAAKGFTDLVTVVGSMAEVHIGSVLSLTGSWKVDAKYGRQFSIESYEKNPRHGLRNREVSGVGPHKRHRAKVRKAHRSNLRRRHPYGH